jgi:hypothetical protein
MASVGRGPIVETYDYVDAAGVLQFQQVRHEPKAFSIRSRDASGAWHPGMNGGRKVLYRLPDLIAAHHARLVWILEGEKDVETLANLCHLATCNPFGAGKWSSVGDDARRVLSGRCVRVIADRDDVGRQHARDVAASLRGAVQSVVVLECTRGKDVTEHLSNGGTLDVGAADGLLPMQDTPASPRVDTQPATPRVELEVPDDDAREPDGDVDDPSPASPGTSSKPDGATPAPSKPESRATLTIVSAAEMAKPLPPIPWLVHGLRIAPGAPTLVAGYGFSGKTVFVQSLALAVAWGRSVLGFPARKGRVLHLDYEQGSRVTFERYQRLSHACGLDLAGLASLEASILPPTIEVRAKAVDVLSQAADGRALVIVDSWRPAHPGVDENSSEVRATLDVFGEVSERTGCAFVLIHHSRKPDKDSKGGAKMAVRGSSGFFDGSQCVITLAGEPGEPIGIESHKDRISGQPFEAFNAQILDVDGRRGLSLERVDTVSDEGAKAETAKAKSAEKATARAAEKAAAKAAELALEERGRAVADALRNSTQDRAFVEILREHPAGITSRDMLAELRARLRSVTNGAESEIAARLANRLGQAAVQRLTGAEGFHPNAKVFRLVESAVHDALRGDDALRVGSA